ncbi:MAG: hypothetical protein Q7S20_01295 [Gemmatimonadaceae bacterium]|nr:hypothetical protein [Gemmatimonadaceae bacterium]
MPRPRRAARDRRPEITTFERRWAFGEPLGEYAIQEFFTSPARLRAVWEELRDEAVAAWAEARPGTRQPNWWDYDAPEPRRRLGGIGDELSAVLAHVESWNCGIPSAFYTEEDSSDYPGEALWNHAQERPAVALDPCDPPRYESQAAYLDWHALLTAGERSRLERDGWPGDEIIEYDEDPETVTTEPPTMRTD